MLTQRNKSLIAIIQRSQKNENGFCQVAENLEDLIADELKSMPKELIEAKQENSRLYVKLTQEGEIVAKYLL